MRRDSRGPLILIALFAAAGLSVVGYLVVIVHLMRLTPPIPEPHSSPRSIVSPRPTKPACPTTGLPHAARLGEVAWIQSDSLMVIDLGTCRQTLVGTGAAPPVRFSHDGRWMAFGDGEVVPSAGGEVREPFGSPVRTWEWSPTADVLAGVTARGGVLIAGPGRGPDALLPGGSRVGHLAFSPDGRRLAVDRAALLGDPDLLVLDEPTNGLDPAGINDMRQLISGLSHDERSVMVSSHILSELEQVCDWLIVIDPGALLYQGPADGFLGSATPTISIDAEHGSDRDRLADIVRSQGFVAEPEG